MFGVGIFEVLVILIVAVIALGPNKLPQTIVDVVKFFRAVKKTMAEAKETFDKEVQLSEIKQETLKYKDTLQSEITKITRDIQLDELREIRTDSVTQPIKEEIDSLQSAINTLNDDTNCILGNVDEQAPLSSLQSAESLDSKPFDPTTKQDTLHNV